MDHYDAALTLPETQQDMDVDAQAEINAIYDEIAAASVAGNGNDDPDGHGKQLLLKRLGKVSETLASKQSKVCGRSG